MPETPEHSDQPADKNSKWQPIWDAAKHSGFRVLLAFAGVVLIAVILFAYKTPDPSQQMGILVVGILGVITFVVTVINAVSAARMTDIMERQESEMTEQRKAMQKQLDAMREGLAKTQEQIGLSRETNDVAQQSLIFSQRAYLTAHLSGETQKLDNRAKVLNIQNCGNTPANDVTVHYYTLQSEIEPKWDDPGTAEDEARGNTYDTAGLERLGLIAPNQESVYAYIPYSWSSDHWEKWKSGDVKLYCWGYIEYSDIFGGPPREAKFAFVYTIDEPNGKQCTTGNSAY